jgi:hypothetical protein
MRGRPVAGCSMVPAGTPSGVSGLRFKYAIEIDQNA